MEHVDWMKIGYVNVIVNITLLIYMAGSHDIRLVTSETANDRPSLYGALSQPASFVRYDALKGFAEYLDREIRII